MKVMFGQNEHELLNNQQVGVSRLYAPVVGQPDAHPPPVILVSGIGESGTATVLALTTDAAVSLVKELVEAIAQ